MAKIEVVPQDKQVLDQIRELYRSSGARFDDITEELSVNPDKKTEGDYSELTLDAGIPDRLTTQNADYSVIGSHLAGDTQKFRLALEQNFETELVRRYVAHASEFEVLKLRPRAQV